MEHITLTMGFPCNESPESVFQNACSWDCASAILNADTVQLVDQAMRDGGSGSMLPPGFLYIPSIACAAFATELYLKCLIKIETGKLETGHDISRLFSKFVKAESKKEIEKLYTKKFSDNPDLISIKAMATQGGTHSELELENVLRDAEDSFHDFRYCHERGPKIEIFISINAGSGCVAKLPDIAISRMG